MKTIKVAEVYQVHGTCTVSIPQDSPLENIINRLGHEPELHAVFLVDSHQRLAGVITRISLMKWAHSQLFGGRRELSPWEVLQFVDATKAKDLIHSDWQSLAVKESDNLESALNIMIDHDEDVLPVLDSEGTVLGDLRLSEVLLKALEVGRQARP